MVVLRAPKCANNNYRTVFELSTISPWNALICQPRLRKPWSDLQRQTARRLRYHEGVDTAPAAASAWWQRDQRRHLRGLAPPGRAAGTRQVGSNQPVVVWNYQGARDFRAISLGIDPAGHHASGKRSPVANFIEHEASGSGGEDEEVRHALESSVSELSILADNSGRDSTFAEEVPDVSGDSPALSTSSPPASSLASSLGTATAEDTVSPSAVVPSQLAFSASSDGSHDSDSDSVSASSTENQLRSAVRVVQHLLSPENTNQSGTAVAGFRAEAAALERGSPASQRSGEDRPNGIQSTTDTQAHEGFPAPHRVLQGHVSCCNLWLTSWSWRQIGMEPCNDCVRDCWEHHRDRHQQFYLSWTLFLACVGCFRSRTPSRREKRAN
eukprot:COSAG02_NODE_3073_length_7423_cov_10.177635_5_plen_383_part_00